MLPVARLALSLAFIHACRMPIPHNDILSGQLTNDLTGANKCLGIANYGKANTLTMADCEGTSGQAWTLDPTGAPGTYRFKTAFTGPRECLDVVNDGRDDKLTMAACGNGPGQMWRRRLTGRKGVAHLVNDFTGIGVCLDIVNDGNDDQLTLARCGDHAGQKWSVQPR